MGLIRTCQLAGVNSFESLTELQRHTEAQPPAVGLDAEHEGSHSPPGVRSCRAGKDRLRRSQMIAERERNASFPIAKSTRLF